MGCGAGAVQARGAQVRKAQVRGSAHAGRQDPVRTPHHGCGDGAMCLSSMLASPARQAAGQVEGLRGATAARAGPCTTASRPWSCGGTARSLWRRSPSRRMT